MKTSGLNSASGTMQLLNAMLGAKAGDATKATGADFESLLQQAGSQQSAGADQANQQGDGQTQTPEQDKAQATDQTKQPSGGQQTDAEDAEGLENQALAAALVTGQPVLMPAVQPQEVTVEEQQTLTVGQVQAEAQTNLAVAEVQTTGLPQAEQPQVLQQAAAALPQQQTEAQTVAQPQQMEAPQTEQAEQTEVVPQLQQETTAGRQTQQQAGDFVPSQTQQGEEMVAEDGAAGSQTVFAEAEAIPVKVMEAEQPLEPQADDAAEQLANKLNQALQQGESRVTINLTPANLGNLTVEMTRLADGTLNVVLSAVTEKAANLLQQHSNSLQNLLQSGTQNQVRVEVENRTPEDGAQQFLNPDQEQHQQEQQQRQQRPQEDNPAAVQTDFMQQLRLGLVNLEAEQ